MFFLFILTPVLLTVLAFDALRLLKEAMWKELAALLFFWSVASFMAVAAVIGLELPNPTDLLNAIFELR